MTVKVIPTKIGDIRVGDIAITKEKTSNRDITIDNNAFVIKRIQPRLKHHEIIVINPRTEMYISISLEDILRVIRVTF